MDEKYVLLYVIIYAEMITYNNKYIFQRNLFIFYILYFYNNKMI